MVRLLCRQSAASKPSIKVGVDKERILKAGVHCIGLATRKIKTAKKASRSRISTGTMGACQALLYKGRLLDIRRGFDYKHRCMLPGRLRAQHVHLTDDTQLVD